MPLPQVRVAARLHGAAEALVALREELPEVNVSSLAARNLPLLLLPTEQLRQEVQQVPYCALPYGALPWPSSYIGTGWNWPAKGTIASAHA